MNSKYIYDADAFKRKRFDREVQEILRLSRTIVERQKQNVEIVVNIIAIYHLCRAYVCIPKRKHRIATQVYSLLRLWMKLYTVYFIISIHFHGDKEWCVYYRTYR